MERDRTNVYLKGSSAIAGEASISMGRLVVEPKPPEKPPWYKRVKDRNLDAMKKFAPWLGKNLLWEIGKWLLGFRRQPAEAGQI